ncbi:MAG TPA: hypothetical protein VFP32_03995 [Candidatus Saccharimonadales bacterium]|nr:hypothetical protein [Candidatus Saccharimonadales bacterium]
MHEAEIDPIIAALADPELIARQAVSRFRYHRPTVEQFVIHTALGDQIFIEPFTLDTAVADTMQRRSLAMEPINMGLMHAALKIAASRTPNYRSIDRRRIKAADQLRASLDQQG